MRLLLLGEGGRVGVIAIVEQPFAEIVDLVGLFETDADDLDRLGDLTGGEPQQAVGSLFDSMVSH